MKTYATLKRVSDAFFDAADEAVVTKPWAVVVAMHEYARNLYPSDPHIPFRKGECPTERLHRAATEARIFLSASTPLGHYQPPKIDAKRAPQNVKVKTGEVYGALWSKFNFRELTINAANMLVERLTANGLDPA